MENTNNKTILKKALTWLAILSLPNIIVTFLKHFFICPSSDVDHFSISAFIAFFSSIAMFVMLFKIYKKMKKFDFELSTMKKHFYFYIIFNLFSSILYNINQSHFYFITQIVAVVISYFFIDNNLQGKRKILRKAILFSLIFNILNIFFIIWTANIFSTSSPSFDNNFFINISLFLFHLSAFVTIIFDVNRIKFNKLEEKDDDKLAMFSAFSMTSSILVYYFLNDEKTDERFN